MIVYDDPAKRLQALLEDKAHRARKEKRPGVACWRDDGHYWVVGW